MGNPNTVNAIKQHITGGSTQGSALCIFEHEGTMWATNKYWVTPASRVAPLLEKFNLDPGVRGAYEVNGGIHRSEAMEAVAAEKLGRYLDPAHYPVALVPSLVAGEQVYTRARTGHYRAVYQAADGAFLGPVADDLEWLSMVYSLPTEDDCYYGTVRYMAAEPGEGARVVAVIADLIRRVSPVTYGTDPVTREQTRHGGETENMGPRVLGFLTVATLGAGK
jgi:hypothetical protein